MVDKTRLLLVEDDLVFARRLKQNFEMDHYDVEIAESGRAALDLLKRGFFDLIITDIRMPGLSGLDVLRIIKEGGEEGLDPDVPVVVLTSVNSVDAAVEAMKLGAADYITKESERKEILLRIEKVLEQSRLLNENRFLRDQIERSSEFQEIIGSSEAIRKIKDTIREISNRDVSVLIMGETGVGKDLVARAIHRTGLSRNGPFLDVNCGALPDDNLLQSELFGHERGAFTGATAQKKGKFELAQKGTLFLDEISELSRDSQAKILKAIETRRITRLGGTRTIEIDCRFIFATNKNLAEEVKRGNFREDLYYRVNVFPIFIPPLRERREDIGVLARFFLDYYCRKYRKPPKTLQPHALRLIESYDWPGNVRELKNVLERLVICSRDDAITYTGVAECGVGEAAHLDAIIRIPDSGLNIDELERQLVLDALKKANWNQKEAAALLGISVDRMNSRVRKYGIKHPSWRVHK
jgi:DNA-binding NtrC family response regulator